MRRHDELLSHQRSTWRFCSSTRHHGMSGRASSSRRVPSQVCCFPSLDLQALATSPHIRRHQLIFRGWTTYRAHETPCLNEIKGKHGSVWHERERNLPYEEVQADRLHAWHVHDIECMITIYCIVYRQVAGKSIPCLVYWFLLYHIRNRPASGTTVYDATNNSVKIL